jgi:hypothetical protein
MRVRVRSLYRIAQEPAAVLQRAIDPQCAGSPAATPANRLVADLDHVLGPDDIRSIEASDVLASRVVGKGENRRSGLAPEKGRPTMFAAALQPPLAHVDTTCLVSTFLLFVLVHFFTTGSRLASPVFGLSWRGHCLAWRFARASLPARCVRSAAIVPSGRAEHQ